MLELRRLLMLRIGRRDLQLGRRILGFWLWHDGSQGILSLGKMHIYQIQKDSGRRNNGQKRRKQYEKAGNQLKPTWVPSVKVFSTC